MQCKTAREFAPEMMQLFGQYVRDRIDRRGYLNRAATQPSVACM